MFSCIIIPVSGRLLLLHKFLRTVLHVVWRAVYVLQKLQPQPLSVFLLICRTSLYTGGVPLQIFFSPSIIVISSCAPHPW